MYGHFSNGCRSWSLGVGFPFSLFMVGMVLVVGFSAVGSFSFSARYVWGVVILLVFPH